MKVPIWLRSGNARWYVGGTLVLLIALFWWDRARIARERREAVAEQLVEDAMAAQKIAEAQRDSAREALSIQQVRTDSVVAVGQATAVSYGTERRRVNLSAPQPQGIPAGMVVVPRSFVTMADSLLVAMREMIAAQAQEREATGRLLEAAARTDSIKDTIIEAQAVQLKAKGGGLKGKLTAGAIGAGVGLLASVLLARR